MTFENFISNYYTKHDKYPSETLDKKLKLGGKLYTNYKYPKKLTPDIDGIKTFCDYNNIDFEDIKTHINSFPNIITFWQGIESKFNIDDIIYFIDNSFTKDWGNYVKNLPNLNFNGYIPSEKTLKNIIIPNMDKYTK